MKILQTINNDYFEITDEKALSKIQKKYIKSIITEIPQEAKPTKEELDFINEIDSKLIHLENKILKSTKTLMYAKSYKNWSYVRNSYPEINGLDEARHMWIEYDVDKEYAVTAIFIVDLDNRIFYVELQQSGITLPYVYEQTKDLECALNYLEDYIENPEDYSDYK